MFTFIYNIFNGISQFFSSFWEVVKFQFSSATFIFRFFDGFLSAFPETVVVSLLGVSFVALGFFVLKIIRG